MPEAALEHALAFPPSFPLAEVVRALARKPATVERFEMDHGLDRPFVAASHIRVGVLQTFQPLPCRRRRIGRGSGVVRRCTRSDRKVAQRGQGSKRGPQIARPIIAPSHPEATRRTWTLTAHAFKGRRAHERSDRALSTQISTPSFESRPAQPRCWRSAPPASSAGRAPHSSHTQRLAVHRDCESVSCHVDS
jgi:hypothetical protein